MGQKIRIDLIELDVHDDADNWPNGKGEIYCEFKVDNDVVVSVPRKHHVSVNSGGKVLLNESHTIERDAGQSFNVLGSVSEADGHLSFDDDHAGSFVHTYSGTNGWGVGMRSARLRRKPDVTVRYKISLM